MFSMLEQSRSSCISSSRTLSAKLAGIRFSLVENLDFELPGSPLLEEFEELSLPSSFKGMSWSWSLVAEDDFEVMFEALVDIRVQAPLTKAAILPPEVELLPMGVAPP